MKLSSRNSHSTQKSQKFKNPISLIYHILFSLVICLIIAFCLDRIFRDSLAIHSLLSDLIYLESIYQDLFIRGYSLSGWLVSRAPYFFPDWVGFFALRGLIGNYGMAWYAYIFLNFSVLIVFFYALARFFFPGNRRNDVLFSLSWSALLVLILKQGPSFFGNHTFILPAYHSGAFLNGLLLVWIWIKGFGAKKSKANLLGVFALSILAVMSDEWWLIWFVAPMGATALLLTYQKKIRWQDHFSFFAALGFGITVGEILIGIIEDHQWLFFSTTHVGSPGASWFGQAKSIVLDFGELILAAPVFSILTVACLCIIYRQRKQIVSKAHRIEFLSLHWLVGFSILIPFVVILLLKLWSQWNFRYVVPLMVLPWFLVGIYVQRWRLNSSFRLKVAVYFIPFLLLSVFINEISNTEEYLPPNSRTFLPKSPYSSMAQCLDMTAVNYELHAGASEYWMAKFLTETNRSGIMVNQFNYFYQLNHWMNNLNWYRSQNSDSVLQYDFFTANSSEESFKTLLKNVGPPTEIVFCDGAGVFIYKGHGRELLNELLGVRVQQYFDLLRKLPSTGLDLLADSAGAPVNKSISWSSVSEPVGSEFTWLPLENEVDPSGSQQTKFLRWKTDSAKKFAFLEIRFDDIRKIAGNSLTLSFWGRSLKGSTRVSSHGYLLPQGILDATALHFGSSASESFKIKGDWKKFEVTFYVPQIEEKEVGPLSYAVIRPLFVEDSGTAAEVDMVGLRLLTTQEKNAKQIDLSKYSPYPKASVAELLSQADRFFDHRNFQEEFRWLKQAELTLPESVKSLSIFAPHAKAPPQNSALVNSEINWRIARFLRNYFLWYRQNSKDPLKNDLMEGYIRRAAGYAFQARRASKTPETAKWLAVTSYELLEFSDFDSKKFVSQKVLELLQEVLRQYPQDIEALKIKNQIRENGFSR